MTLDDFVVIVGGSCLILFVYWFFLNKKDKIVAVKDTATVIVEGGYTPNSISIPVGKPVELTFIRKDASSCLDEVVLPDFKVRRKLPINKPVTVSFTPTKVGSYQFSCGMQMFHGTIKVV